MDLRKGFSAREKRIIATTFAITALIVGFVTFNITRRYYAPPDHFPPIADGASMQVDWKYASDRMDEYERFQPLFNRYRPEGSASDRIDILKGFMFEAAHLDEIIRFNHSVHGNPDTVMFYLAQDGTFIDDRTGTPVERPRMNLIALGIKNNIRLTDARSGMTASIFDKASPCPPRCPNR